MWVYNLHYSWAAPRDSTWCMVGGSWLVEVNTMAPCGYTSFFFKKKNGNDWLQLIFMSWKSRAAPEREPGKDAPLNQINPQSPHSSRGNDSQFLFSFHTRTEYWLDCKLHRRIAIAYTTPLSHTNKRNFSVFQKERCCGICESPWAIQ
jgi:hypothetical protein